MEQEKLFEQHCALVRYVYNKEFFGYTEYKEDLFQEGYIALWKCCSNFSPELGYKFTTYACKAIRNSMLTYVNSQIVGYYIVDSFEKVVCEDYAGGELLLKDILGEEPDDTKYLIEACLDKMTSKEQTIIRGLLAGFTQDYVSVLCGVSQKYVSVRLNKFREFLKEEMKNG